MVKRKGGIVKWSQPPQLPASPWLRGAGFWGDFGDTMKSIWSPVLNVAQPIVSAIHPGYGTALGIGRQLTGLGVRGRRKKKCVKLYRLRSNKRKRCTRRRGRGVSRVTFT